MSQWKMWTKQGNTLQKLKHLVDVTFFAMFWDYLFVYCDRRYLGRLFSTEPDWLSSRYDVTEGVEALDKMRHRSLSTQCNRIDVPIMGRLFAEPASATRGGTSCLTANSSPCYLISISSLTQVATSTIINNWDSISFHNGSCSLHKWLV